MDHPLILKRSVGSTVDSKDEGGLPVVGRAVARYLGVVRRAVRRGLAAFRSEDQGAPSAADDGVGLRTEGPGIGGQQTDRAIVSTAQGVITGDRIFDAGLVVEGIPSEFPVEIAIGPQRLLLRWIEDAPGERPIYIGGPTSIEISDITSWAVEARYLGIQTRDRPRYRFALQDDAAAHRAEELITQAVTAAGGRFTVR